MGSNKISSGNDVKPASNYDEIFMQRTSGFADNLKELRKIRAQLYSAAEYFEETYHKNDHDNLLFESLKDYVSKALIKTIDHLGSVTYKVNGFLNENVDQVSETKLRLLCIEQKLGTCQTYGDRGGLLQQSLMIQAPRYHKQYLIPDGQFPEAVQAEKAKTQISALSNKPPGEAYTEIPSRSIAFSFTKAAPNKRLEKRSRSRSRSNSPLRFPIKRTELPANQSTSPSFPGTRSVSIVQRSISPISSSSRHQHSSEAWRSHSLYPERGKTKDIEVYTKKTTSLFKALLSIHKSKNNDGLYSLA